MSPPIWLFYLVATILVEALIVLPMAPRGARWRTVGCCVLANLFTHPLLSTLLTFGVASVVVLELFVIAAEALAYRFAAGLSWQRSYMIAVVTNVVTWAISAAV